MAGSPLQRVLAERFEGAPGVLAAFLFGSHAAGRAHRESDVDIGVLLDRERYRTQDARFEARLDLMARLGPALSPAPVDVVILNDVSPMLARAIVTAGGRVYCRDAEILHAFVRTTLLRAADLAPFLQRMRRLTLDAIAP